MALAKKKVLFICKNNSGRSQMAEALLENTYGDHYQVYSAGSHPTKISPLTIEVLNEIGIDISHKCSKSLNEFQEAYFDYVASLCGDKDEVCPVFLNGKTYLHHGFPDPRSFKGDKNTKRDFFRKIRDEIQAWLEIEFKID
jgi:arsenate reductase (thioredoxin)